LAYSAPEKQFHVKKNLHLHLNMDAVTKPELPVMMTTQPTNNAPPPRVQFAVPADNPEDEQPVLIAHGRRRISSVTLSMDSPEGAEFGEVAHDGPAELGKRTKKVKRLGKGAGGTVYLSIYLPELKLVAVKEVLVYKEEERHTVKHELHALHENLAPLGTAPHSPTRGSGGGFGSFFSANAKPTVCPYQVSFYGAYLTPAKCAVSIVMEFLDMGSLQDLVCNISTPEPVVRHAAFCCLTALEHMHNQR
jgi:mitogen-activated protein kinase kinase